MSGNAGQLDFDLNILPKLPRSRELGIGCIGAGFIMADCQLVAYRQAGFNIRAISSRSPQRAAEVAARHAIPKVYETYQELLADPEVQVVDVAVPPDVQLSVIRRDRQALLITCAASWRKSRWEQITLKPGEIVRSVQFGRHHAGREPEHAVTTSRSAPARRCSSAANSASPCWPRSTCAPFRTGCPGSSGKAGSRCGS